MASTEAPAQKDAVPRKRRRRGNAAANDDRVPSRKEEIIMTRSNSLDLALGAVTGALARVAARSDNPLTPDLVPAIAAAVADEAAADPALRHAANSEAWYASRVTWGALIAAIAPILGMVLGRTIGMDDLGTAAGTLIGAGLALYGRWFARTPIGSR